MTMRARTPAGRSGRTAVMLSNQGVSAINSKAVLVLVCSVAGAVAILVAGRLFASGQGTLGWFFASLLVSVAAGVAAVRSPQGRG